MDTVIAWLIIILVTVGVIGGLAGINYSTTRAGSHTGYVTAIQQEGYIFHNYKVFFKTDNQSSQEDSYCIQESDKELADELKQFNKSRQLITINYDGVRGWGFNLCHLDRIISVSKD